MAEPIEQPNSANRETGRITPDLPRVESPPLSPGDAGKPMELAAPPAAPEIKPVESTTAAPSAGTAPRARPYLRIPPLRMPELQIPRIPKSTFKMSRRLRHRVALAATVMLAASFGAAIGAVSSRTSSSVPVAKTDTTAREEASALQKQVARLSKELAALKTGTENAARESRTQMAKLAERLDHAPEITGSIAKQAAVTPPPASAPVEKPELAPIPQPRPAIAQTPAIVPDWAVLEARPGRAVVANRGEVYEVAVGNPLPGLGGVEAIRRDGNKWVVVTSRGTIMPALSSAAMPPRGYVPYYQRY